MVSVMCRASAIRLTGVLLIISCLGSFPFDLCGQNRPAPSSQHFPWACVFLDSSTETDAEKRNDPAEEQSYAASLWELYRLWCTLSPGSKHDRERAANRVAAQW